MIKRRAPQLLRPPGSASPEAESAVRSRIFLPYIPSLWTSLAGIGLLSVFQNSKPGLHLSPYFYLITKLILTCVLVSSLFKIRTIYGKGLGGVVVFSRYTGIELSAVPADLDSRIKLGQQEMRARFGAIPIDEYSRMWRQNRIGEYIVGAVGTLLALGFAIAPRATYNKYGSDWGIAGILALLVVVSARREIRAKSLERVRRSAFGVLNLPDGTPVDGLGWRLPYLAWCDDLGLVSYLFDRPPVPVGEPGGSAP